MAVPDCVSKAAREAERFRAALLGWYNRNRRILPWRAMPGQKANPYHVWLSEIMLQQTTVGAVIPYFQKFIASWPTLEDLAHAQEEEVMKAWAGLGYYSRARNLYKCSRLVAEKGGFPEGQEDLKKLPGIGDYTSAAITSIAFDRPATVIDGNVERVLARYYAVSEPLPDAKKSIRGLAESLSAGNKNRPGDFAQAMMDLGATICVPRNPRCNLCPISNPCRARQLGIQNELPKRGQRAEKPKKIGYVYWIENDKSQILLHTRPPKGLLGGMVSLPTSEWVDEKNALTLTHPDFIVCSGQDLSIEDGLKIEHVFTHFKLALIPIRCSINTLLLPTDGYWEYIQDINLLGFPSVFKKVALSVLMKG